MIKFVSFLTLLGLLSLTLAEDAAIAASTKTYAKCPCKCFFGRRIKRAFKQCSRPKFLYQCHVEECVLDSYKHGYGGYKGKWCCDKPLPPKPSATPSTTPTPTPSITPTPSSKPICPCYCGKRFQAVKACHYKPWCKVIECPKKEHPGHGYPHSFYTRQFQCCYKY